MGELATIGVSLKMYFDPAETLTWSRRVAELAVSHPALRDGAVELFVLPAAPLIASVVETFRGTPVGVGAQDLFWADRGAYTGGISGADLKALGCEYVEVGHSERRLHFGEDDAIAALKLEAAFRNGLTPVICVGERRHVEPYLAGQECVRQLERLFAGVPVAATPRFIVAYEPEWAIGATSAADADGIREVSRSITEWLSGRAPESSAGVIYGGAAGPGLLSEVGGAVNGLFLGRRAHDPAALSEILDEAAARRRYVP
jgi:triosephosphate isomerase